MCFIQFGSVILFPILINKISKIQEVQAGLVSKKSNESFLQYKLNLNYVHVICTSKRCTFFCLFALPTFTFVRKVHLFVNLHCKLTDSALICLYALQKLMYNPLINGKCNCMLICTSKLRIF